MRMRMRREQRKAILLACNTSTPFRNDLHYSSGVPYCKVPYPELLSMYVFFQPFKEHLREFTSLTSCRTPHLVETIVSHYILSDSDCVIKVYHRMPESSRNEYGLSRVLYELYNLELVLRVFLLYLRQNFDKIVDCLVFIMPLTELFPFDNRFWNCVGEEHPTLMPC